MIDDFRTFYSEIVFNQGFIFSLSCLSSLCTLVAECIDALPTAAEVYLHFFPEVVTVHLLPILMNDI